MADTGDARAGLPTLEQTLPSPRTHLSPPPLTLERLRRQVWGCPAVAARGCPDSRCPGRREGCG